MIIPDANASAEQIDKADADARAEEMPCQRCGRRNPVWWTGNAAWNLAVSGHAHREGGGIMCPSCFHRLWLASTAEPKENGGPDGCP